MVIVKSFSVGNGDMFYIKHSSDNFSLIDCCLTDENKKIIVNEIKNESKGKTIIRFISTHPDEDHIQGLEYLDSEMNLLNFYCVKNNATKKDNTPAFCKYCELRDSDKAFHMSKGCSRKWMNESDNTRGSAGIDILWPETNNEYYKEALENASKGESPNNICPIIKYSLEEGVTMIWMGDLESSFLENIKGELKLPKADILFASHHGRKSGSVPKELLDTMQPKIIIVGEAPSDELNYYRDYNTITQNTAGDITFDCDVGKVHIYVSNEKYNVDFLKNETTKKSAGYIGTLNL
jgi:beta-lactamase superfamily II metal-dependent hydrolase